MAGSLAGVRMDAELPLRADLGLVFNELDFQLATQAYLWALPLVSFAQWQAQHRDVFGATSYDLVHYATYQDKLGDTDGQRDHAVHAGVHRPEPDRPGHDRGSARPDRRAACRTSGSASSASSAKWAPIRGGADGI